MYRYNGYDINDCGDPQSPTSKGNWLLGFLFQMRPHLEQVIADAQLGTRSKHGYAAFFKSATNIRKVTAAYQRLLDAQPIIVDEDRVSTTLGRTRTPQPLLLCVNDGDAERAALMFQCNAQMSPMIIWPGTEVMVLCPRFFEKKQYPFGVIVCPDLGSDGRYRTGDGRLMSGLFATMVYLLTIMYERGLYEEYQHWGRPHDMQWAVDQNTRQSVMIPESYGFYAGGE